MDDGYINTEDFELPSSVENLLTTQVSIRLSASLSPEMIWDHISGGKSWSNGIRYQECHPSDEFI